jgi:hypothetical protein
VEAEIGETCGTGNMDVKRKTLAYRILEGQSERMRPLGRSRLRKEHKY